MLPGSPPPSSAEVVKGRNVGVVNERVRNAIQTQTSQYDTLASTYDAPVLTPKQKLSIAADRYEKLEVEAKIYHSITIVCCLRKIARLMSCFTEPSTRSDKLGYRFRRTMEG